MKKVIASLAVLALAGCASSPKLYSPVLPMEDGTNTTETMGKTEQQSMVMATRNAERYCKFYTDSPRYVVISRKTDYAGLLSDEDTARNIEKGVVIASRLSFGVIPAGIDTDWRTTLVFKCWQ